MKLSLHIGLNLVDPAAYNGWTGNLNACVSDAAGLAALCARRGFKASGLVNEQASLDGFRSSITQLAATVKAGDSIVISYSGHGGQGAAWSADGYRETLCLFDGQLTDVEFLALLKLFATGVNVTVIFDSCHSGGMNKGMVAGRAMPAWVKGRVEQLTPRDDPRYPTVLMLCACRQFETALDGEVNGAFTGSLIRTFEALTADGEIPTNLKWENATSLLMARDFPSQHPTAYVLGRAQADSPLNQLALS